LNKIHSAGITVGITAIPLFPYISDGEEDLENSLKPLRRMVLIM